MTGLSGKTAHICGSNAFVSAAETDAPRCWHRA